MSAQRHVIGRQVFEVHCADETLARRLQDDIANIFAARLAPLIARCLDSASDAGRNDRIERLEIDLGRLPPERLADDLAARIERQLAGSVREAIMPARLRQAKTDAPADWPQIAVLDLFARTGLLPWSTDPRSGRLLADAVETAAGTRPDRLAELIRRLARDPAALERLARQLDDDSLETLVRVLAPHAATVPRVLLARLGAASLLAAVGAAHLRAIVWRQALDAATTPKRAEVLVEAVLAAVAETAALPFATVLAAVAPPAGSAHVAPKLLDDALSTLMTRGAPQGIRPSGPAYGPSGIDADGAEDRLLTGLLVRVKRVPGVLPALLDRLAALTPLLPAAERDATATALGTLVRIEPAERAAPQGLTMLRALLRPFVRHRLITAADAQAIPSAVRRGERTGAADRRQTSALDADAVYLETAGVSLLWPFLATFFSNLGLIGGDHAFVDEAARHRAVGLLHHIATGDREPPEYWLALNKVLCGMDLLAVHAFGEAVTDAEFEEAERLLAAVLAHAPSLGTLTIDGLRGSFLLRRGALTTRDGAWLLRVERQSHDVVLEKLPWTMEWIRLPWMQAPLRIEW